VKIILAVALLILFFLVRLFPYGVNNVQSPDGSYFLKLIKEYQNDQKFPPAPSNFLLEIDQSYYPPLFWLFPVVTGFVNLKNWQKLYIPMIEATHFFLLLCVLLQLPINSAQMVLGALVFMSFPVVLKESNYFSARSLGNLLTAIFFIAFIHLSSAVELAYFYFFVTVLVMSITALTHKMSLQFQFAMTIVMSVFDSSWLYLLLIPISLVLAWVVSGGYYRNVLLQHFDIVKFWNHNYPLLRADPVRWISGVGSHPEDEIEAFKNRSIFAQIPWIKNRFDKTLWRLSGGYIWVLGVCLWLNQAMLDPVVIWISAAIIIILCIDGFPWLRAFGEGFKYTRYLAFPMALVFSQVESLEAVAILVPVVFINLINSGNSILKRREQRNEKFYTGLQPILKYIKKNECKRVYCLPINLADDVVLYTDTSVFWGGHSYPFGKKLLDFFPVHRISYRRLFQKYDIQYVLVDKRKLRAIELFLEEEVDVLIDNEFYLFMKIRSDSGG